MSDTSTPLSVPRAVKVLLARLNATFRALSRPARVLLGTTTVLAVLFGGFVAVQKANEPYAPLFSQLEREDAAAIVAKLKELKVPYKVDADGSTIEVPESKARELRLELAGAGLPRGGGVGFESFDKMRMGATDFEQRVLYRRALEGELTRTIGTLGAVESARVHLVLSEKSVFITRGEPASASIVLRLRHGRSLGPSEVGGVVHLVASAVPGLEPDRIAVVTTEGVMLHRPRKSAADDAEGGGAEEDARGSARSYESSLEERVRTMLERVVGPGHADVRVTAEMDPARVERVEEHYDPARSVLRSEEQSVEHGAGDLEQSVAGVPGAESNLPTGAAKVATAAKPAGSASPAASTATSALPPPAAGTVSPGSVRESHTRNYEIDHVSEKRSIGKGALKRIAVAVVLDGSKGDKGAAPRSREELDKITLLVRSAAGASELRGDTVTVESMVFADTTEPAADLAGPTPAAGGRLQAARRWAPYALGAVLVLGLATAAWKRRRAATPAAPTAALSSGPQTLALEAAIRPVLDSADLRTQAHLRATQDPATAALVLRFWLGTSTDQEAREPTAS